MLIRHEGLFFGLCVTNMEELMAKNPLFLYNRQRYHLINQCIGYRIRLRREVLNLRLSDIAQALNVSIQQAQKYEIGENGISTSQLWKIANFLNVEFDYFYLDVPNTLKEQNAA